MRDSFIFYRSFFEAINELPESEQLQVYKAISEYSLNFNEIELTGIAKTIFILIKPQLEANNKRFINGTKPKTKLQKSKSKARQKQNRSKTEANNNVNDNVNSNINENNNIYPSFDEFKNYAIENEPLLNLQALELKYKAWIANGWKDGNDKAIKNWKTKILNTIQYLPKNQKSTKKLAF